MQSQLGPKRQTSDLVAETVWYMRDQSKIRTERRYLADVEYSE